MSGGGGGAEGTAGEFGTERSVARTFRASTRHPLAPLLVVPGTESPPLPPTPAGTVPSLPPSHGTQRWLMDTIHV